MSARRILGRQPRRQRRSSECLSMKCLKQPGNSSRTIHGCHIGVISATPGHDPDRTGIQRDIVVEPNRELIDVIRDQNGNICPHTNM